MPDPTTDWRSFVEASLKEGTARVVGVNPAALGGAATRRGPAPRPPPEGCSESVFQDHVRLAFLWGGWKFYHTRRSKGSDPDFPDNVGIRRGSQGVVSELKVGDKRPTPGQLEWLELFRLMGFRTAVWYPRDWPRILEVLA